MPNETQIFVVRKQLEKSSNDTTENRLRNSKLNDRLLTGKSRQKKLILPSDYPFQKRNLSKFPMEYNRTASKQHASGQYLERKITEEKVRKAKYDSENLRQYSLKMFDNAVQVHTQQTEERKILSEIPTRTMSAHNGPTHNGSLLYNKKSNVLNSIRLRPQSEPPTRFNHLKSQTIQPEIKQALFRSNREYTVSCITPTNSNSARSVSALSQASEFILIPNGSVYSDGQNLDDTGKSETNDSVFEDSHASSSIISLDPCFLKRNLPSATIHFYSIEEDSSSDESVKMNETEVKPIEEPKKEVLEPPKEPARPKSGKGRPKSGTKKRSASPKGKVKRGKSPKGKKGKEKEPKPITPPPPVEEKVVEVPVVRKPLKGPKCWVDDATITSEKETTNGDELGSQTSKPGSPSPGKTKVTVNFKCDIDNHEFEKVQTLPEPKKIENSVVLEEIEHHSHNGLPRFICPSSEVRSRQEAIKDWLAKCSFESASRCVPLF